MNQPVRTVNLKFFASVRDWAEGREAMPLELSPEVRTIGDLRDWLARLFPGWPTQPGRIMAARNQRYATLATPVEDGDEIAFFPPVSGG